MVKKIAIKLASLNHNECKCTSINQLVNNQNSMIIDNMCPWNFVCKSKFGYDIAIDEYKKTCGYIK